MRSIPRITPDVDVNEAFDAVLGGQLLKQLDAKWYEQGVTAAQMGLSPNDPGLFSVAHRQGYQAGQRGQHPVYANVSGLPALARGALLALLLVLMLAGVPAPVQAQTVRPKVPICRLVHGVRYCLPVHGGSGITPPIFQPRKVR